MGEAQQPVVSAAQVRERLAALRATAPMAPTAPTPQPEAPVSEARRTLRERVVLLDYFALEDLLPRAAGAPPAPADEARAARLVRQVFNSVRGGRSRAARPERPSPKRAPVDDSVSTGIDEFACKDCEPCITRDGDRLRLLPEVRQATLDRLGTAGARAALNRPDAVRPGDDDVTHAMARRLLEGERELRGLSATELSGILRARDWLAGLRLDLPTEAAVRSALDVANVVAPLRAVLRDDFVGRERELQMLQDHLSGTTGPLPLALHGPGGVGKSTLIAKFVLDHVERSAPTLFCYLSFDRGDLDVEFQLTLVSEACRQFSLQDERLAQPLLPVRAQIAQVLEKQVAMRNEAAHSRGRAVKDAGRFQADEQAMAGYLAEVLRAARADEPVLVVLDTFEMAQRKHGSFLAQLGSAMARMQERLPSMRVVITGRAPVVEIPARNAPLEGLDETQSMALLRSALRGVLVDDALLRMVVDQVSGNPLNLRLAADLIRREGPTTLGSRRGRRRLLFDLRSEQVQGVLYRRILDHVDPQVRPLANPGLVLRRITADVIQHVLAEPCGLKDVNPARAAELFDLLRGEVSLVSEVRPGVLVHRADVRREMLPLLAMEDSKRVVDIHKRAIRYYSRRTEVDDRIEELYHRLTLGESTETLDRHWDASASPFLEDAWDELPPASRVYLAGRLGVEADPEDLREADQTAWVRQATRHARSLLEAGSPAAALDILMSRETIPRDLLVSRRTAEALAGLGRNADALAEAERATAAADQRGLGLDFVQLSIVAGRIAEDIAAARGDGSGFDVAQRHYIDARESGLDFGARADALTAGVGILRVQRRFEALGRRVRGGALADPDYATSVRPALEAEAAALGARDRATHPGLVRELAAELGSTLPDLFVEAAKRVGVEAEGSSVRGLSEGAQTVIHETVSRSLPEAPPLVTAPMTAPSPPGSAEAVTPLPRTSSTYGEVIAEALQKTGPRDDELKKSLLDYWQLEVDRPAFDYGEGRGSSE